MRYSRSLWAIVLILPSSLAGQSVLGSSGLGMRLEPLDATQRALGGVGVTTRTAIVIPGNPMGVSGPSGGYDCIYGSAALGQIHHRCG